MVATLLSIAFKAIANVIAVNIVMQNKMTLNTIKVSVAIIALLSLNFCHCQNCVHTIENAFNSQEGFYAKVNTEDNTVTILSKQEHTADELIDIVTKAGYTSKAL